MSLAADLLPIEANVRPSRAESSDGNDTTT
jgi:hypothetical protein